MNIPSDAATSVFLTASRKITKLPGLDAILSGHVVYAKKRTCRELALRATAVLGWGRKPSALMAEMVAVNHGLSAWRLEDGFLRSVDPGSKERPLSIVLDKSGIYYDANSPSDLETLIACRLDDTCLGRACDLIESWRSMRVSKYNHAREYFGELPSRYVLVADQTLGDASIKYGLADESSFQRMIEAALVENPECTVLLKTHPEVMLGRKKGHFDIDEISKKPRIKVLGTDVHPVGLIERAEAVYVVTSQIGFEGLLWGKRVRTFGMPFYAGWGLTEDDLAAPERRKPVPLENLVYAALVEYARYIDPETGKHCEAERVIEWMGLQRRMRERLPETVYALDFYPWKRPVLRDFFQGSLVKFIRRPEDAPDGAILLVWGKREIPCVYGKRLTLIRLEDGFIRSVGLGANLVRPLSWVMDRQGIYYDATAGSELEELLLSARFESALLRRAGMLSRRIIEDGITKYNFGTTTWKRPQAAKRVILVPGQVEGDASIVYGSPLIRRNIDLLRAVREANKDAHIVYKPHPDVVTGLRKNGEGEDLAYSLSDEVVVDSLMGDLLEKVDEVHTMTSLSGFEALLRGKKVTTYGQPFYAGWGLTEDKYPVERRKRRLTLDELVVGSLILYPAYMSNTTGRFTTPERALKELLAWRAKGPSQRLSFRRRVWIKFLEGVKTYVPQIG